MSIVKSVAKDPNSSGKIDKYIVSCEDGKTYDAYYNDGKITVNEHNGFTQVEDPNVLAAVRSAVRPQIERESNILLNSTFGSNSKKRSLNAESFEINIDNIEDAICRLRNLADEFDEEQREYCGAVNKIGLVEIVGADLDNFNAYESIRDGINDLANNLFFAKQQMEAYARGEASVDDVKGFMSERFGFPNNIVDTDDISDIPDSPATPAVPGGPGGGGYYGGGSGGSSGKKDTSGDKVTSGDNDDKIVIPGGNKEDKNPIGSSIAGVGSSVGTGAGVGGSLLGLSSLTASEDDIGDGTLIDGDSILDELGDKMIVPKVIRNTVASVTSKNGGKVGAAVGVGLAGALAGGGLYYYSQKEKEDEEKEEETEESPLKLEEYEEGAVEGPYSSGLSDVMELKDAIMNDDLESI